MASSEKIALRTALFSIITNTLLATVKGLAGFFGNSYALIADAIESIADVFSSIIIFVGLKIAVRPADKNHPYGHGRVEVLVTFVVVGFLIGSAAVIAYESIQKILIPHEMPKPYTLYVLAGIILWKEISFQIVIRKSRHTHSSSLRADAWHHRSDAITSVVAFIGISIALFMGEGYEAADDWAALAASLIIVYNSYKIFRPALGEMMDEHTHEGLINEIREKSLQVKGVVNTEKCFIRKTGVCYQVDLHARVDGQLTVCEGHNIAHRLKNKLRQELPQIQNVLIHIEPSSHPKAV